MRYKHKHGTLLEQHIRFCTTSDRVRIAYATMGKGPPLVRAGHWLTHLQYDLDGLVWRHWTQELCRSHLYVRYDQRGCGLSDWEITDFSFDALVRDLETVTDTLRLDKFALLGVFQGGAVSIAYTVRHPERVSHLILYGAYARGWNKRMSPEELEEQEARLTLMRKGWGKDNPSGRLLASAYLSDASIDQITFVGDDLEKDYFGSRAVGMTPVLVDRKGRYLRKVGLNRVSSLTEIPTLL